MEAAEVGITTQGMSPHNVFYYDKTRGHKDHVVLRVANHGEQLRHRDLAGNVVRLSVPGNKSDTQGLGEKFEVWGLDGRGETMQG